MNNGCCNLNEERLNQIVTQLESSSWMERSEALFTIGKFKLANLLPEISSKLNDEDDNVRNAARWALNQLDT